MGANDCWRFLPPARGLGGMMDALHGFLGWLPLGLPTYLCVMTVIVFFHELGHFLMARAFDVKVDTFSIGFGPAIAGWTDRKGTLWKISWIPFGGYVKFYGDLDAASTPDRESIEQMPEGDRIETLQLKPLYQRALVAFAGPLANFILAIVILAIFLMAVGEVTSQGSKIGDVTKGSPAATAGLMTGDIIQEIDGTRVKTFDQVAKAIHARGVKPVDLALTRSGRPMSFVVRPAPISFPDLTGGTIHKIGIGVSASYDTDNLTYERLGPIDALGQAAQRVWFIVTTSLTYISRAITGHADSAQLSGPVEIAHVTQQVASSGILNLISLVAFLSVSIGLVNLFPIPILDGGHLLYYGCEAVLGRPLNARAQDLGFRLGLAVVLGLMVFATWNDLVRLNLF
jgi:regulator of sigma E protease